MGLLEDAIAQGNYGELRNLSPLFQTAFNPAGATYDPRSPMGFTIADPGARASYGDAVANLERNAAGGAMQEAYARDRLKNTLAVMKVAEDLDPDLQEAVLARIGIRPPGGGQQGLQTPWGSYMGARGGEAIFGGGQAGPRMSRKLGDQMALLRAKYEMEAPQRELVNMMKELQLRNATSGQQSQELYRRELINSRNAAQQTQMMAQLDNFVEKKKAITDMPGWETNPESAMSVSALNQAIRLIQQRAMALDQLEGGGGPPSPEGTTAAPALTGEETFSMAPAGWAGLGPGISRPAAPAAPARPAAPAALDRRGITVRGGKRKEK